MADNLIPEPQIQATSLPMGGGAQVKLGFAAPDQAFVNLSQTLANASKSMVNFADLERREEKAKDSLKQELKSVLNLKEENLITDNDYQQAVKEMNTQARKQGIIAYHDDYNIKSAIAKDRMKILGGKYEDHLQNNWSKITNPDNDFRKSIGESEQEFFSEIKFLGKDSNGNPVTNDVEQMNVMEKVALSELLFAKRTAAQLARDDVRTQRSKEGRAVSFQSDAFDALDAFATDTEAIDVHPLTQRTVWMDRAGNYMTELSRTSQSGDGRWVNFPMLNHKTGKMYESEDTARSEAALNGTLFYFDTLEEAEMAAQQRSDKLSEGLEEIKKSREEDLLDLREISRKRHVENLKIIANNAHDEEVDEINARLLGVVEDYVMDIAENAQYNDPIKNAAMIREIIDVMQKDFFYQTNPDTGKPIMFASRGSANNRKLDAIEKAALSVYSTRMSGVPDQQERLIAELKAEVQLDFIEKGGQEYTKAERAEWLADWNNKASARGIIDYESVIKDLDISFGRLTIEIPETTNEKEKEILFEANSGTDFETGEDWKKSREDLVTFYKKIGMLEDMGEISPSVANNARTKAFETFRRDEPQGGAKVSTTINSLNTSSSAKNISDRIEAHLEKWHLTMVNAEESMAKAFGIDFAGMSDLMSKGVSFVFPENVFIDAIVKDSQDILVGVQNKGYDPQTEDVLKEITDETALEKLSRYIPARDYEAMKMFFNGQMKDNNDKVVDIESFPPVANMEIEDISRFKTYFNQRQRYLIQLSGAMQMLELENSTAKVKLPKDMVNNFIKYVRRNEITFKK